MYADTDVRNDSQAVLSRLHTKRMSLLTKCRLEPLKPLRSIQHNTKLKSDEIRRQNETRHVSVRQVATVQLAFLNTFSINTVELGYIVMKGTEYFVSL
jgi:hypothetical protein